MKLLFHIHTNHSYDSCLKPRAIIDFAMQNNIFVVAITDHDTMSGSYEAACYVKSHNLNVEVIQGAEYYSSCGDIIGLFIKEEIKEREGSKLIDEIHRQGGIAILPHPYKGHILKDEIIQKIDIIETFNARCSNEQNSKASDLAVKWKKTTITGNDAHLKKELSLCYTILNDLPLKEAILAENKQDFRKVTSKVNIILSQWIKGFKKGDFNLIIKTLRSFLSIILFQPVRSLFIMKRD